MSSSRRAAASPTRDSIGENVMGSSAKSYQRNNASSFDLPRNVEDTLGIPMDSARVQDLNDDETDESEVEKRQAQSRRRTNTLSKNYADAEEKAVIRKLDHIGNARIAGLEKDLQLSDIQFDYCLIAFYVTYITFEWMILLYRLVPAHIYISLCVLAWGIVASLQSAVTSFTQLLVLRACLGVTEAAFGPGVPFYMTFFYRRSELAYRVGLQISAAPLATSFASSLAWVIVKLSQNGPLAPWRALFLFEGFPSIITAVFAWYFIPDSPETARYLNARERKVARLRLQDEQSHENQSTLDHDKLSSSATKQSLITRLRSSKTISTLMSPLPWLQALIFLSINVSFASLPVFLPTVINSMSFSPLTSQILSAPPYLLSFLFVLYIGHFSDSHPNTRGLCLMFCSSVSATSYFIIAFFGGLQSRNKISTSVGIIVRYIAVYPAAMGLFSSVVLIITWNLNNQPSRKEKGLAMMVMNIVGQCGPLIGVNLFPKRDGPYYESGMYISGCFMMTCFVLASLLRYILQRRNKRLDPNGTYELATMVAASVSARTAREESEQLISNSAEMEADAETEADHAAGTHVGRRSRPRFIYML